jgi:hypothetical protein
MANKLCDMIVTKIGIKIGTRIKTKLDSGIGALSKTQ